MSTSFTFAGKQIIIYCATPVFIAGVVGALLNTLVFLSLKTFRQSSCAFYLTTMSILNIGTLFIGLFARILTALTGIDDTLTSLGYCKFRLYFNQICLGSSLSCWCLATIDQYLATCSHRRWQEWCNVKLSQRITIITIIIWMLHGIPYLVFYDHVVSPTTNQTTCVDTNNIFDQYRGFVILLGLLGYLPIVIAGFFGLMAYHNVQQLAYRTVPLVRRELDKQLTVMVLVKGEKADPRILGSCWILWILSDSLDPYGSFWILMDPFGSWNPRGSKRIHDEDPKGSRGSKRIQEDPKGSKRIQKDPEDPSGSKDPRIRFFPLGFSTSCRKHFYPFTIYNCQYCCNKQKSRR